MNKKDGVVGLFIGSNTSFNVERATDNISWMLSKEFQIDLISTGFDTSHFRNIDYIFGGNQPSTFSGSVITLNKYKQMNEPDILCHITRPQSHGNLVSIVGKKGDTTTVYRYGGDTFYLYKIAQGWKRVPYFFLNNVIGHLPLLLADQFVVLGPNGEQRLINRGVPPKAISVLPPSIDQNRFSGVDEAELDVPHDRSVVLFVGRRTHLKGIRTMQIKIPEILDRRDDLQFVFVGSGPDLDLPDQYEDHVTIVGRVPPEEIPEYHALADVLVLPSLTEGVPRVLLEALAAGTPVVARNVGEIPTVTENVFEEDDEFVEMVCGFEDLQVDPIEPYFRENLKSLYIEHFRKFIR